MSMESIEMIDKRNPHAEATRTGWHRPQAEKMSVVRARTIEEDFIVIMPWVLRETRDFSTWELLPLAINAIESRILPAALTKEREIRLDAK
jgi:hypothetical protein